MSGGDIKDHILVMNKQDHGIGDIRKDQVLIEVVIPQVIHLGHNIV